MAKRFKALNIPSLLIARMDVTEETPPAELAMIPSMSSLPLVLLLPADSKRPPWNFYTGMYMCSRLFVFVLPVCCLELTCNLFAGVGKMQTMMKWVQEVFCIVTQ